MTDFSPRRILKSVIVGASLALPLAFGVLNAPLSAAAASDGAHGHSLPPAHAAQVNPHRLPTVPPTGDTPTQLQVAPRHFPVDQATYEALKARADADAAQRDSGNQGTLDNASPTSQFATLTSTTTGGWNPPDGALAVGPTSELSGANEAFAVYDRSGNLKLGPVAYQTFFAEPSSTSIYDPRALYDAGNGSAAGYNGGHGRFVLLATDGTNFTLGVSQNETPESNTTAWCTYLISGVSSNADGSTDWVDYPSLGMDGNNLYVTSNQFSNVNNTFQYPRVVVVSKASVYPNATSGACGLAQAIDFTVDASGAPLLQNPGGGASFTVQPANQPDALPASSSGTMYFVNSIWSSGSNLVVRSITTGPGGSSPTLNTPSWVTTGFIAPYNLPARAPQPSSSARIDTGDDRLLGATFRYGNIYTANTTGTVSSQLSTSANPYANAQWYTITPTSSTTYNGTSAAVTNVGVALFFPGVLPVCASGATCATPKVVLELSASGKQQPASAARAANGTVSVFNAGIRGYTNGSRWGDYPGVAADPLNSGTAWLLGEYARTTTAWGTAVTSVTP